MSPQDVTARLQAVLKKKPVNVDEVLRLSSLLAADDGQHVRFSVDAGLIDRLGRELVSKQETAVAELIKNSYDADALNVDLSFEDTDKPGGRLTILDNGLGMTRIQLVSGFMRLSSMDKVREPVSPRLKRRRAGRKGIGRFAVQRLGEQLEITTQTKESETALRVSIDWARFQGGTDLNSIASRIENVPKERVEGTTLRIHKLREAWSEKALRSVYRIISELIQPVTLRDKRPQGFQSELPISEAEIAARQAALGNDFQITLRRNDGKADLVVDEMSEILQYALAVIEGFVDSEGQGYWAYNSDQLKIREEIVPISLDREDPSIRFQFLRDVDFKAYYFIHRTDLIPRAVFTPIKNIMEEHGGIRLYRNGYRVLPYGEKGDDWLSLEASSRNRDFLPGHANYNFLGFVEIYDAEGKVFEETASREGLLENETLEELQNFVYRSLMAAVRRIAEARGRKTTASQKGWKKPADTDGRINAAIQALEKAAHSQGTLPSDGNGTAKVMEDGDNQLRISASLVADVVAEINQAVQDNVQEKQTLMEEAAMLRVLSSLGIVIAEFTHEVKQTLGAAKRGTSHLKDLLPENTKESRVLDTLDDNLLRANQYVAYFDRAVQDNNQRELQPQDLQTAVISWMKVVAPAAQKARIKLHEPIFEDDIILTCPMHVSELASVLFNFHSNALKAIRRAGSEGEIQVTVGRGEERVFIEFCDNGDGVALENADRVFNAFYTTSTPADAYADDQESLQGSGLGLKIVRDIAQSYGGEVTLVDAPAGFTTCFRVELPEASAEMKADYLF